ncbi:MAG: TIGR00730 family Rossman fold protein [Mucilaginibacter sp.]
MKNLCIFCGANYNGDPLLANAIDTLTDIMANRDIALIYGGGKVGVMGMVADAILNKGGKAIGVIPKFLMSKEIAHPNLTQLHAVDNMHQRKQMMTDLCDGYMTLPGGLGTMEEFFEVLTWLQLGLHNKPVGVLNTNGFYDLLLQQLDVIVEQSFLKPVNRSLVLSSGDPTELMQLMDNFKAETDEVWFRDRNLT